DTTRGAVAARLVIAADGATGTVARAAGWAPNPGAVPALEYELVVPPAVFERLAGAARFDFGVVPHGYAWVFPKRDRLSVGALSTQRGFGQLRACLEGYLKRLGITEIREVERHGYVVPLRPAAAPFVRNRTLLVGDAAGFADPITAEGISFAALSGALAAEAILEARLDGGGDRVRRAYDRRLEQRILGELRFARVIAKVLYDYPRARAAVFRRFGGKLAEAVASAMCGETTYRQALRRPANYLRLLRRAR
ncbi:MAG: geranylgeranyl reductase, partial [Gemmatimonadales bacterium]